MKTSIFEKMDVDHSDSCTFFQNVDEVDIVFDIDKVQDIAIGAKAYAESIGVNKIVVQVQGLHKIKCYTNEVEVGLPMGYIIPKQLKASIEVSTGKVYWGHWYIRFESKNDSNDWVEFSEPFRI